jgi:hypothetical protein
MKAKNEKVTTRLIIMLILVVVQIKTLKSQILVVSTSESQIIYQHLKNPIKTNLTCFGDNIELFTENGEIVNIKNQTYWKPNEIGKTFLKLINKENQKILDSIEFQVKSYGLPTLRLNKRMWHSGIGDYNSEKLIFNFSNKIEYLNLEENIKISSFEMYVRLEKENGEIENYTFKATNEEIPKGFDKVRKQLKVGDFLIVELKKIRIQCNWMPEVKYYDEYTFIPEYYVKWVWKIR